MPISARCSACGKSYQLADEQAGLRVRCRECNEEFDVPRPPEVLEAVATARPVEVARRARPALDEPAAVVQKSGNPLAWILGILGGVIVMLALVCGGIVWMLTVSVKRTVDTVSQEVRDAQDRFEHAAREAEMAQKEAMRKEAERAKEEAERAKMDLKLPDLPKVEIAPAPKDFDDALAKLKSPDKLTRLRALSWVNQQQQPGDPVLLKKVRDAIDERTKDEDEAVRAAAELVKIVWAD